VTKSITELAYRPSPIARSLAADRHDASGIVFPNLSGPYYSEVIYGFEREAVQTMQSVLILGTHGRDRADDLVLDLASRVDGLVIMGRTVHDRFVEQLGQAGMPIVLLARSGVAEADTVRAENERSAALLVEHLFAHDRRELVFVGDPDASPDVSERWAGFVEAHRRANRPRPRAPLASDFTEAAGYSAIRGLLGEGTRRPIPDALVCANDEIALGARRAARETSVAVPGDLAVTGWDDIPAASLVTPTLTTVRQPMRELGAMAATLLAERIAGRQTPRHVLLPTSPVYRASCGCQASGGEIA
jgi:LacI family transcriptional regulator